MSNNTSLVAPRRSSWSPDLWVPYVLIGSSCVTFLALHFWCYHKRNRERVLRQREERQLKFGLMERRRTATLILERYHGGLGVNSRTTDVDLPQTPSDSNTESFGGDHEDDGHDKPPCTDVTKENTSTHTTPDLAVATEATSSHSFDHWPKTFGAKTLANSRSWPLVGDGQNFVGSALTLCPQNTKSFRSQSLGQSVRSQSLGQSVRLLGLRDGVRQASPSVFANHETSTVNTHEASPNVRNHHGAMGSRFTSFRVSNPSPSTGRTTRSAAAMSPTQVGVPRQPAAVIPRPASRHRPRSQVGVPRQPAAVTPRPASRHRPRVFCTDISAAMRGAATQFFSWRHSKRRHDGSHVGEGRTSRDHRHTASLTCNHWGHYKAHQSEKIRLTSFYNHGDGTTSDNYKYTNCHVNQVSQATRPSLGVRHGEMSYLGHADPVVADKGQPPHISRDTSQPSHISRDTGQDPHISRDTGQSPHTSRDTGLSPHISRDTGISPHISRDTGLSPHISRDTGQSPHISRDTSLSSHISRDTGQDPYISRDTGQSAHTSRDTGLSPHISRDTSLSPHISRDTGLSPHISRDTGQSSHISRDTGLSSHISRDTGLSPHISRDTGLSPHISRDTGQSPHISRDTGLSPHISRDTGLSSHISRDTSLSPHISRDTGLSPHISRDTGQSPYISRDTGLSSHISRDTGLSPHIPRDTGQSPHISQDMGRESGQTFQCPPHTNTRSESRSLWPGQRPLAQATDSNRDAGWQEHMINNQSASHGPSYLSRRDFAGSDRSDSETLSVTFGKVSGAVVRHPTPQVCIAGSQGTVVDKASRSYSSQAGSRIQSQTVPTYYLSHQQTARPHVRLSELSRIPSVCESVPFLFHRKHIRASRQDVPQCTHEHAVSETDSDSTPRTVPRLQFLDPNLICNYTQRYSPPQSD